MRLIDADKLKENIEYALLQHEDTEKWLKWFNQVIDAEPTVGVPWYMEIFNSDKIKDYLKKVNNGTNCNVV